MADILAFSPPKKRREPVPGSTGPQQIGLGKTCAEDRFPCVLVKPFGGHFSATFLTRSDGSEDRLQIFPDKWAASRSARLINNALREARL